MIDIENRIQQAALRIMEELTLGNYDEAKSQAIAAQNYVVVCLQQNSSLFERRVLNENLRDLTETIFAIEDLQTAGGIAQ